MKKTKKDFKKFYLRILNSLIFYPAFITIIFFILSTVILSFENFSMGMFIQNKFSYLYLQDTDTARTILTTLVASILSLMVFSFSMVMVVLSQASSNYSPRLLPQLISDKKRQIILGFYGGTLMHCILTLISLGSKNPSENSIGFSTMIAAILGLICVILFIYFIQNISSVIRIDIIVKKIFKDTEEQIDKQLQKDVVETEEDFSNWTCVKSHRTGYFKDFDQTLLISSIQNSRNSIHIVPYEYEHIWEGDVVIKIKNKPTEKEREHFLSCLLITEDRFKGKSFTSDLIKLMEVAVKAMSPGINDPGTATDVLYKLGRLLNKALQLSDMSYIDNDSTNLEISQNNISAEELMRIIVRPIRNYSKSDTAVNVAFIRTLNYLMRNVDEKSTEFEVLEKELKMINEDIKLNYKNSIDQDELLNQTVIK